MSSRLLKFKPESKTLYRPGKENQSSDWGFSQEAFHLKNDLITAHLL